MKTFKKAKIKQSFSVTEWLGHDYDYEYGEEIVEFNEGDEVLVLHEAEPNVFGKIFVVFSEKCQESTTVSEMHLEFI